MAIYPENYQVAITVLFTDLNGTPIVPTEVRAALWDGDDQLVVDFGTLPFLPEDGQKEIVIPAPFNVLEDGQLSAARILRVELVTDAGSVRRQSSYLIEGEFRLALMVNSFISMEAAELLVRDMPGLSGWNAATTDQRYAALIDAYHRLTRIPMKFKTLGVVGTHQERDRHGPETIIPRSAWSHITEAEFLTYPIDFRKALRMAQLCEANEQLEGDSIAKKHRQGVVSETIGESSITLRGGRIDTGVASQTLNYLTGYVYYDFRIQRA